VNSASLGPDNRTVTLGVSSLSESISYLLTVNNVTDRATTPNKIQDNSTKTFDYVAKLTVTLVQYYGSDDRPTVVEDGFVNGAVQANDRAGSQWTNVPSELSGLTYLLTARDDKSNAMAESGVMYRVNVSSACTVFVMVQANLAAPTWIGTDGWNSTSITVTADGNSYAVYNRYFDAGDIDLKRHKNGSCQGTGYVFKISGGGSGPVIGLSESILSGTYNIAVYPNPFSTSVNIQVLMRNDECGMMNMGIYDISGRLVYAFGTGGVHTNYANNVGTPPLQYQFRIPHSAFRNSYTWDASDHPAGIYFCRLKMEDRVLQKKITLLR
jgi:hypothetical protein